MQRRGFKRAWVNIWYSQWHMGWLGLIIAAGMHSRLTAEADQQDFFLQFY